MAEQFMICRVEEDLINLRHIREINKPTPIITPVGMKTHEIIIEFAYPNMDGTVKTCAIFKGSKKQCDDFRAYLQESIAKGNRII